MSAGTATTGTNMTTTSTTTSTTGAGAFAAGATLELCDVRVYYGAIQAVKGVSLEVRERELVTVVGANGAGKTTTLRTISGLFRPRTGTITYGGHDLTKLPSHEIVALGLAQAPEGRQIFGSLSVRENLLLGATRRDGRDRHALDADLDRVFDLFPVLKERIGQAGGTLSGGEQQMLAIGRALMAKPKLLLLDEPSLGLAPLMVGRIFEVIARLKAEGTTILLVEQNARKALQVADRAYVMETGVITLSGPAAELAANPEVEKAYLGGLPPMNPEKILAQARNHPNGVRFSDLLKLVEALGYRFDRQNGSHRIYIHPGVPRKLNLQPRKDGKAKEYQVRELLRLADEFGLSLEDWS